MIWFWVIAALLILMALAALLRPLVSRTVRPGDNQATIEIFRRQLADIDTDLAQGRLPAEEAAAARAEITRRLLTETDREAEGSDLAAINPTELSWRVGAALGVAGLLPAAALAVYFAVGAPAAMVQLVRKLGEDVADPDGRRALRAIHCVIARDRHDV